MDASKKTDGEAAGENMKSQLYLEHPNVQAEMNAAPKSREERAAKVISDLQHAVKHNAPVPHTMVGELRDLLGVPSEDASAKGSG